MTQLIFTFITVFFILNHTLASSANDNKLNKKLKHYKESKQSKKNYFSCSDYQTDYHPTEVKKTFIPTLISSNLNERKSSNNLYTMSTLRSFETFHDLFSKQCYSDETYKTFETNMFEIVWRYQFYESQHCIRVELDLGNITKFKDIFNYHNYMFSSRELARPNNYLKRQKINDQSNFLTINQVNIRPYIVCVSFYKNDINLHDDSKQAGSEGDNATLENPSSSLNCSDYSSLLLEDERMHDVDLCIDIDTQTHFLSSHHDHQEGGIDRELVMVIFIICLLVFVLFVISLAHYIIEKPKKKSLRQLLYFVYRHRKSHSHDHNNNNNNQMSLIGSANSLNKDSNSKVGGPQIVVTDFSSNASLHLMSQSNSYLADRNSSKSYDESKESDPLLSTNAPQTASASISTGPFVPVTANSVDTQGISHKVKFHIGETIIEESPNTSEAQLETLVSEPLASNDTNEECIKTISHLLDDKPWAQTQLQTQLNNHRNSNSFLSGSMPANISSANIHSNHE